MPGEFGAKKECECEDPVPDQYVKKRPLVPCETEILGTRVSSPGTMTLLNDTTPASRQSRLKSGTQPRNFRPVPQVERDRETTAPIAIGGDRLKEASKNSAEKSMLSEGPGWAKKTRGELLLL
jgi:hypothetical protein